MAAPLDTTMIDMEMEPGAYQEARLQIARETQALLDPGAIPITEPPRPLTAEEVKEVLSRSITEAESLSAGQLASARKIARDYYEGKPFGNEVQGHSTVVSQDLLKVVEWVKPQLMRIFTSSPSIGRYLPEYDAGEPYEICEKRAEQATDYMARKFEASGGFMFLLTLISDGLLEKTGIGKVVADRKVSRAKKTFRDLTTAELVRVLSAPGTQPVEYSSREEDIGLRDPMTGAPVPVPLHDISVVRMTAEPQIEWVNVPPEHVLHTPGHPRIDERIPFIGDRSRKTRSELLAMGLPPDRVFAVPVAQDPGRVAAAAERYEDEGSLPRDRFRPDTASEEVWFLDGYLLIDEDGDGYSERRRILAGGDPPGLVILDDQEVSDHPYFGFSPVPLPYRIDGMSFADIMADLQLIRSTLLRQILNFVYLNNMPITEVDEANVNVEDMLTRRPGGIVRSRAIGSIQPHPPQSLPAGVFELLAGLDQEIESRTGVSRATQLLDPAAGKNQTLGGVTELLNSAAVRVDLIARIVGECAIRPMFAKALRLLHEHAPKREIMRLRGDYVEMNPAEWNPAMKVEIDVVLGAGQSGQRLDALRSIAEWQLKFREMGLVHMAGDKQIWNGFSALVREAGFRYPEKFLADPDTVPPPPPPPPDPKLIEEVSQMQKRSADTALDQAELILDAKKAEIDAIAKLEQARAQMISAMAALESARRKPSASKS